VSALGEILWSPPAVPDEASQVGRYLGWLAQRHGRSFAGYDELHRWSVSDLEGFWGSLWEFFGVRASTPYERVLRSREMPGAEWFVGARLNYAEHMLGDAGDGGAVAVVAHSQTRNPLELTFADLREQVTAARTGLQGLGVGPGDRVVGYLPNIPETLIAFLATASLGAIWAACPPEFGPRSVIDRFAMLEPKVMLAVAGYRYGERAIDRSSSSRSPSITRCACCSPPARPGCRRRSSTVTAGSSSSTSRTTR
jgi:acetoacetyl-CoA synthetase